MKSNRKKTNVRNIRYLLVAVFGVFALAYLYGVVSALNSPTTSPGVGGGALRTNSGGNLSVGATGDSATKFFIKASSTSASDYSLRILQPDGITPLLIVRNDGKLSIGTSPSSTVLTVAGGAWINGALTATTIAGSLTGTLSAANVSSGAFGSNTSGGNYSFPADLTVAGDASFSGPVKLGSSTSTCSASLEGLIRYNATNKYHEYCDATAWSPFFTDLEPDLFSFTDQTAVGISTLTNSNIVQITGIAGDIQTSVSGAGGQYQVCSTSNCSSVLVPWTSSTSTIAVNQYLQLRLTSSASYNTGVNTTMIVGTGSDNWSVTTTPTANAFSFTNLTGAALSSTITSNTVALAGGFTNLTATCGSGCTAISRNGGAFVAGPVVGFNSGDTIAIRLTSSASYNTAVTATVTVGGTTSGTWSVTTTPGLIATYSGAASGTHNLSTQGTLNLTAVGSYTISFNQAGNIRVRGVAGGGGGDGGGGGGGGANVTGVVASVTGGTNYSAAVGGGGSGAAGGNTTFGSSLSLTGGGFASGLTGGVAGSPGGGAGGNGGATNGGCGGSCGQPGQVGGSGTTGGGGGRGGGGGDPPRYGGSAGGNGTDTNGGAGGGACPSSYGGNSSGFGGQGGDCTSGGGGGGGGGGVNLAGAARGGGGGGGYGGGAGGQGALTITLE